MSARSGELFAGVGGLGMAVDEVFGTTPAWFAEFEPAPSRVLAARHPGVPNVGDVTLADWAAVERVSVLSGGFPCQDVSLAGRRRGLKDGTRSGLWSEFARAIEALKPEWVVIENVRGLLSADAAGVVEPCPWCMGDTGDQHPLRALGAVLGDLADLGFDAEWCGLRASDVGAAHGRFRIFILAWPLGARLEPYSPADLGAVSGELSLLPTPVVNDMGDNKTVEWWDAWTDEQRVRHGNGNGHGPSLGVEAQRALLPTPVVSDGGGGAADRSTRPDYGGTPFSTQLREISQLLPTPQVADGTGGHTSRSGARIGEPLLGGIATSLLPTPMVGSSSPAAHGQISGDFRAAMDRALEEVDGTNWGRYSPAISRWARVLGRPAPPPVQYTGRHGAPRLNPALPEWMMGWPEGWVTDPRLGLSRSDQLKAAGNGVVPQQAATALRLLRSRAAARQVAS